MDNIVIESFIAHCDDMMIAEEGLFSRLRFGKRKTSGKGSDSSKNDPYKNIIQNGGWICTNKKCVGEIQLNGDGIEADKGEPVYIDVRVERGFYCPDDRKQIICLTSSAEAYLRGKVYAYKVRGDLQQIKKTDYGGVKATGRLKIISEIEGSRKEILESAGYKVMRFQDTNPYRKKIVDAVVKAAKDAYKNAGGLKGLRFINESENISSFNQIDSDYLTCDYIDFICGFRKSFPFGEYDSSEGIEDKEEFIAKMYKIMNTIKFPVKGKIDIDGDYDEGDISFIVE